MVPPLFLLRVLLLLSPLFLSGARAPHAVAVRALSGPRVLDGDSPRIVVTGLRPGEHARVHAFRRSQVYPSATTPASAVLAHAIAVFIAGKDGTIEVDSAAPVEGTYRGADPLGLLWSGTRMGLPGIQGQPVTQNLALSDEQDVLVRVEAPSLGQDHWAETRVALTDGADSLETQDVALPGLNGAFARPKTPATLPLPAIILLHGSEGGSTAEARGSAMRFARLGYAAFALNYFAWPPAGVPGVPHALIDIPVEEIASARTWLMRQPGVDAQQVALWGVSKGAELSLVAASYYSWIDRVVACVPSSVVWSGFGRPPAPGEIYSSWSIAGAGLPYIPYDRYEDVLQGKLSAAFVHQRSLDAATPAQRAAARIPVENSHAHLLLLAATKDVVWFSASMTASIEASLRKAHRENVAQVFIFADASHYICGTGSEPRRINPVHKPEGDDPTPEADAHAAAAGWQQTKMFLRPAR